MKKIHWNRLNRKVHYWGAIICALPVLIVIVSGLVLQLKKDVAWVQPPSAKGQGKEPTLTFAEILEATSKVPEAGVTSWSDIDRLDVRPGKGIVKVRCENRWEIQLDGDTAEVLQVAFRRSDLIEAIHDGSFFHEKAKLWIFLPSAVVLLVLWVTGIWLFVVPLISKRKRKVKKRAESAASSN